MSIISLLPVNILQLIFCVQCLFSIVILLPQKNNRYLIYLLAASAALMLFTAVARAAATFLRAVSSFCRSAASVFCSESRALCALSTTGETAAFIALVFFLGFTAVFFLLVAIRGSPIGRFLYKTGGK